jgi:hypothetical protein
MQDRPTGLASGVPVPYAGEAVGDYRARLEHHQAEAAERRQSALAEQSSPMNTAGQRIRIWERLHQVDMPRNPTHRLLPIIAANTGLSLAEVLDEQRLRAAPPPPPMTAEIQSL